MWVLSADVFSMKRVLPEDGSLLKYSYRYVIKGGVIQASATADCSVDAKSYGEALRRLGKAKGEMSSPVHRKLPELFIICMIAENHFL